MKTKAEVLQKYIDKTKYLSSLSTETGKLAIFQAMEEYAQQFVNSDSSKNESVIPPVINRRELLIDFIQWYNKECPHDAHLEWLVDDYEESINSL